MGVRTKVWGPHAWLFFHGVANAVDRARGASRSPCERQDLLNAAKKFFAIVEHVLPCIHCRKSYGGFILEHPTKLNSIGFEPPGTMAHATPISHYVFRLHTRVNTKLYGQEVEKYGSDVANVMWGDYEPLFDNIVYAEEQELVDSMIEFVYYVLCDYHPDKDISRCARVRTFIPTLAKLMIVLGFEAGYVLENMWSRSPFTVHTPMRARVAFWHAYEYTLKEGQCMDFERRYKHCDDAVVKC